MLRICYILNLVLVIFANTNIYSQQKPVYILDMVHNNPGEELTHSRFNDPNYLKQCGYTGIVFNDFIFPSAAITFKTLNPDIFPLGSKEAKWVENAAACIKNNILKAHRAGIKAYYFMDMIVLPKKLVKLYHAEICDAEGKISMERPKTVEIHRILLDELFETFPDLDGLVIRTGETYTQNVPYHTGNNPITQGVTSHIHLLQLLRAEVCVKRNKKIFYRTWSFGGMHDDTDYYLKVTSQVEPHPNLIFSIKHTKGDFQRTNDFNPTLTLGKHQQIVEVQCQREYEGKGAYPNYIMKGIIDGFEEYSHNKPQPHFACLKDIKGNENIAGILSWSRGGGWAGPYISNEFWCKLNAWVLSNWVANTGQTETQVFNRFMDENGIKGKNKKIFRAIALYSSRAVITGHASLKLPFDSNMVYWMRDEFLSGIDSAAEAGSKFPSEGFLYAYFQKLDRQHLLETAVKEKYESVAIWRKIAALAQKLNMPGKADLDFIRVSSSYGLLLHQIIAEGWHIMEMGFKGDKTGKYDYEAIHFSIKKYDRYWKLYRNLTLDHAVCPSLYKPYAFVFQAPSYHLGKGMDYSVNKYRHIVQVYRTDTIGKQSN